MRAAPTMYSPSWPPHLKPQPCWLRNDTRASAIFASSGVSRRSNSSLLNGRSSASIAAVGFALTAYPVGVARGWITREQARDRTLSTLRFFHDAPLDDANVGRYARLVKEMSVSVQFINNTQNKIYKEMADQ